MNEYTYSGFEQTSGRCLARAQDLGRSVIVTRIFIQGNDQGNDIEGELKVLLQNVDVVLIAHAGDLSVMKDGRVEAFGITLLCKLDLIL